MASFAVPSSKAELAVTTWGTTGPAIVALHPGVGDRRIWQWCAPVWAEAGHRVVAYDRRGFGETVYFAEPHDDLADLMAVTARPTRGRRSSWGTAAADGLALDLALAHPDHVTALVLIAPSPSGYPSDDWKEIDAETEQDALIERAEEAGDLDEVNRLEVRYWLDGVEQAEGRVQGPPRALMLDMNGRALAAEPIGDAAERAPAWPRLAEIEVPVLVIAGEHDLPGIVHAVRAAGICAPERAVDDDRRHRALPIARPTRRAQCAVLEFVASIG